MSRSPSYADDNEPESCQRYTRSELLALRFISLQKPKCFTQLNVSYLGFWKKNSAIQQMQQQATLNNNNSNSSGNLNDATNFEGIGGGASSSSQGISSRTLRNRERATNYYRRMKGDNEPGSCDQQASSTSTSVAQNYSNSLQQQQQPYIDHRSISSSHLMPAFAKRRFAALPANTNANEQQQTANTPNELKDYNNTYEARERGGNNTHRLVKDTKTNYRQQADAVQHSPQRKNANEQQQHDHRHGEQEHLRRSSSSPTHQPGSRHSNTNVNERRIGSGRLLPRDVGWDYRNPEKDSPESNTEKDTSTQSTTGLRATGNARNSRGRYASDRSNERRGGESFNERQPFERRSGGGGGASSNDDGYQPYESKRNQYSIRRMHTKDTSALADSFGGRSRYHHIGMRKEEPEWFSGGPTSQHETIELHGFDDLDESESSDSATLQNETTKQQPQQITDSSSSRSSSIVNLTESKDKAASTSQKNSFYAERDRERERELKKPETDADAESTLKAKAVDSPAQESLKEDKSGMIKTTEISNADFNLDAFFADSLDHTLMHTAANATNPEVIGASRFSRWFANKDAHKQLDAELEARQEIASDKQGSTQNISLMEFLQRGKLPPKAIVINTTPQSMPSVEELEARMRHLESCDTVRSVKPDIKKDVQKMNVNEIHNDLQTQNNQPKYQSQPQPSIPIQMPTQDTDAFRKLLEQLGTQQNNNNMQQTMPTHTHTNMVESHPGVSTHPSSFSVKNANLMLQQQQQQPTNLMQHGGLLPPNMAYDNLKEDEIKKLLQQQQQQHNEMLHNQQQQQHQRQLVHQQQQQQQQHQKQAISKSTPTQIPIPPYPHPPMQNAMIFNQTQNLPDPAMLPNILTRQAQKHTDVQHLLQCLARGDISIGYLEQELQNPNVNVLAKDVIATVLSERNAMSLSCMGRNPIQQMPPHHQILNDTNQPPLLHHPVLSSTTQQDHRHSNARTPVQRTQSYEDMLINQASTTANQTVQGVQQQTRHSNSPTPLAFTPTSVLRKMTAEKDSSVTQTGVVCHQLQSTVAQNLQNQNKPGSQTNFANFQQQTVTSNPHPRMILGGNHVNQQQQQLHASPTQISPQILSHQPPQLRNNSQQIKWSANSSNVSSNKPMGRPILKGPVNTPIAPNQQQVTPMGFASKLEIQQMHQQRLKHNQTPQQPPHPPPPVQTVPHSIQTHITHMQQQQFFHQHHQRALAAQRQQQQQLQQAANLANSQLDAAQNNSAGPGSNNQLGIINYQRDGGLSPTSNQLAQWFSPELLAQASAGKLPLLNVNQALSLEEFERSIQHSSAAVHN